MRTLTAFIVLICVGVFWRGYASASILLAVSDLISDSAPSAEVTHEITFTPFKNIPPSGQIKIIPAAGKFNIPVGFDYTDVDFAVATSTQFIERDVAEIASLTEDGVSVTAGTSGAIILTLNSSTGVSAGEHVRIRLGTNASVGDAGTLNITNPSSVGSHRIRLETDSDTGLQLDVTNAIIAVIAPIALHVKPIALAPILFEGLPQGAIASGNTVIELSIKTDSIATCRYSLTPGTDYLSMTQQFEPRLGTLFTKVLSGFQDDTQYTYYVRCAGIQGVATDEDYIIQFKLDPTPFSGVAIAEGTPTTGLSGNLGNGGAGDFPNGSAQLYVATVNFTGTSIPGAPVTILKDGKIAGTAQAKNDGSFTASITGLERGTYTFQLYSTDSAARTSSSYTVTLTVGQGTINNIRDVIIPPTIAIDPESIGVGDSATALGAAIPSAQVELTMMRRSNASTTPVPQLFTASTTAQGVWQIPIPADQFSQGTYVVKARALRGDSLASPFSKTALETVGKSTGACATPDINKDGKVNLIDFSILLTMWNTDSARGDFNCDAKVNLADFSIMLFNWTG